MGSATLAGPPSDRSIFRCSDVVLVINDIRSLPSIHTQLHKTSWKLVLAHDSSKFTSECCQNQDDETFSLNAEKLRINLRSSCLSTRRVIYGLQDYEPLS